MSIYSLIGMSDLYLAYRESWRSMMRAKNLIRKIKRGKEIVYNFPKPNYFPKRKLEWVGYADGQPFYIHI